MSYLKISNLISQKPEETTKFFYKSFKSNKPSFISLKRDKNIIKF